MLACFLKNNKSILKKFKGGDDKEKTKKRSRANSNVSVASSTKKKDKKAKDKKKKKADDESVARRVSKQRKESEVLDWQQNPEHAIDKSTVVKDFNFSRIKEENFQGLSGSAADFSFEAKTKFGTTGDTYGEWSNSKLFDKHGKDFIKEKNKMKNKNFHASGGRFNMNSVNSVAM